MSTTYTPNDNAIGLQLASPYATGSGSIVLKTGQGAKFTAFPTFVTLITNATYNTGATESLTVFTVTGKSTDTLTGVVVASGYTDTVYTANDYCEGRVNSGYIAAILSNLSSGSTLTPTGVKTANYTAVAGDYVPVSTASGSVTITLPTAPANKSQVGIMMVACAGTNAVTVACGGSDVLNVAGGSTTGSQAILFQMSTYQYNSANAVWYNIAAHKTRPYTIGSGITETLSAGVSTLTSAGGSPGGSTGQVQYDNAGSFGGSANLVVSATGTPNTPAIADPSTPIAGDFWLSSGSNSPVDCRSVSATPTYFNVRRDGTFFSCGACTGLASFTSSASLLQSPASSLGNLIIPANTLKVGQFVEIWFLGIYSALQSATLELLISLGGTVFATSGVQTIDTGSAHSALQFGTTAGPILIEVVAIGSGGSVRGGGTAVFNLGGGLKTIPVTGSGGTGVTTPVSVNTATDLILGMNGIAGASSASNAMQVTTFQARIRG